MRYQEKIVKGIIVLMLKFCDRCRKLVEYNHSCPMKRNIKKENYNSFYSSVEWKKKQAHIKSNCFGLDVYELMINGVILYGNTVHHIVPLADNYNLRLTNSNLILLSEKTHAEIHRKLDKEYLSTINEITEVMKNFYRVYKNVW